METNNDQSGAGRSHAALHQQHGAGKIPVYSQDPIKRFMQQKEVVYAPSQEAILKKGLEIEDKELRALYFGLYGTAARISEFLGQPEKGIKPLQYGSVVTKSTDRHRYDEVKLLTLKNRQKGLRFVAVPLFIPIEVQMWAYFKNIYEHRVGDIFKESGNTIRQSVWRKLHSKISFVTEVMDLQTKQMTQQEVKLHPHLLRHFRLSHLVTLYNYNVFQLQEFAGWSDTRQASVYVSLSSTNLAQQFAKFNYVKGKQVDVLPEQIAQS